jgi:hypothetical protein
MTDFIGNSVIIVHVPRRPSANKRINQALIVIFQMDSTTIKLLGEPNSI